MRIGLLAQLLSFREGYRQAGVSRYIEYLLRYLPNVLTDDDRLVVYASDGARNPGRVAELPASLEWNWTRWPTGRIPVRILWEQFASPLLAGQHGIDLIHGPVNIVPRIGRIASVVTIHDLAFLEYPEQYPSAQRRYLSWMTRASTNKARRVIAVSHYTGDDVAERLGADRSKVVVVPNGVSDEFVPYAGTDALQQFRIEHELPNDFLLFVGTLQPRKNLVGLIRAYAQLEPSIRLPLIVVGGEGWMYKPIFDEVSRLGITEHVRFAGYAASTTLPLWYSAATAFVYPSFYEGFGLPVLEAMSCGTPVVTSNRSSLPEVVGDAGILVDPDRPEDIAGGIQHLLTDSARCQKLAELGYTRAQQFSWQRTARETAAVYRSVIDNG